MVSTFVCSAGSRNQEVWKFLEKVSQTDAGVRLAELEHSSLKKMFSFFAGRVSIYVRPSFYRSLKVRYPMDVGRVSRDGWVTTELGTGSLTQAVGILNPEDFRTIVGTDWNAILDPKLDKGRRVLVGRIGVRAAWSTC